MVEQASPLAAARGGEQVPRSTESPAYRPWWRFSGASSDAGALPFQSGGVVEGCEGLDDDDAASSLALRGFYGSSWPGVPVRDLVRAAGPRVVVALLYETCGMTAAPTACGDGGSTSTTRIGPEDRFRAVLEVFLDGRSDRALALICAGTARLSTLKFRAWAEDLTRDLGSLDAAMNLTAARRTAGQIVAEKIDERCFCPTRGT